MKNHEVTILSAVDELQRAYKALNTKYFAGHRKHPFRQFSATQEASSSVGEVTHHPYLSDRSQRSP